MSVIERLMENIKKQPSGCWEWQKSLIRQGYGYLSVNSKNMSVHRLMYECVNGEIPTGMHVLHRCDNRCCINPKHLFIGTNKDNMLDKVSKNRQLKGEQMPVSKLKGHEIIKIKRLYAFGLIQRDIAVAFNVTQACISHVVNNKTWNHI